MSERKTLFVDIILPVPVHQVFTYRVPFDLNELVIPGIRAVVPFGRSKLITGIITKVHEVIPTVYQAKYIEFLLDENLDFFFLEMNTIMIKVICNKETK